MSMFDFRAMMELFGLTEPDPARPPIVVISGSMRFEDHMKAIAIKESMDGRIVLMPHVNLAKLSPGDIPSHKTAHYIKSKLDTLHKHKIAMADEMIVVCPKVYGKPYIGESTQREIRHAQKLHIPVRYVH